MRSNAGRRTRLRAPRRRASRGAAVLAEWLQLHALVFLAPGVSHTRMCGSDQGRQGRFVVAAVFSSSGAVHWRGKQAAGHCQTGEPQHHQPAIHRAHNPPPSPRVQALSNPSPQQQQRPGGFMMHCVCATCRQMTRIRTVTPPEASSRTTPVLRDFGASLCQAAGSFTASSDAQSGAHPWLGSHQLINSTRRMGQDAADGWTKRTTSLERNLTSSSYMID
ncbi:hypothetical protein HBI56_044600 [Parastagonospora nodorum]|uniref:Uncharacterized protein n=2 Tax=Phaeosphaeria nodorum (strain SN15 / ATCC MYA-4574 / FGSC 10173) TaxID=321614 RepID=A0A7U2ERW0_PHANO|nr:hypothetical protein SNOG_01888 [Parastagonospora nodorum SN15]KAH3916372.1 hypothetical protein HBH56_057730 [Parastagonospora nodorum]EAT90100.1 hypothetical protein SNOG_01888 [Parastagonospora nodorum SN15]KAH3930621.1 hypothetical protein HBH54_101660 [Parastagonospora nodorum]KAH4051576.1 hypothetical protein HBH49_119690 [Parastagonospora nodorum]KAH4140757.1 hypothetical protein HBH45_080130 [Parastagonospora nodorum]